MSTTARGIAWLVPPDPDYPSCDGKRMSDNTTQYEWIVTIVGGLKGQYRDDPNVFVAGDFLWYPVFGDPKTRMAPDGMVVFGRPKGERGAYLQWREENVPPHVVFEVLSPKNSKAEMARKLAFYEKYGSQEYYVYDPKKIRLSGYLRDGDTLRPIPEMNGWVSPRLGIRFDMTGPELVLYHPDGSPFRTYEEVIALAEENEQKADEQERRAEEQERRADEQERRANAEVRRAEQQRRKAEAEAKKAEAERQKAEAERQKAEEARREAEAQKERAERLAARLRSLGIDPET